MSKNFLDKGYQACIFLDQSIVLDTKVLDFVVCGGNALLRLSKILY
jgi:hypothetical protein